MVSDHRRKKFRGCTVVLRYTVDQVHSYKMQSIMRLWKVPLVVVVLAVLLLDRPINGQTVPCEDGAVRLADGTTPNSGRVEICFRGQWGTVCDDAWDATDAEVVCRQLGLPTNHSRAIQLFGGGSGPILLDDVFCLGNETMLGECFHNGIGIHSCVHSEDAGVSCLEVPCMESEYQCTVGTLLGESDLPCIPEDYVCDGFEDCLLGTDEENCTDIGPCVIGDIRLIGPRPGSGLLEICFNETWGTVCDDGFEQADTAVVCRQLGYRRGDTLPLSGSREYVPIHLDEVECTGEERALLECPSLPVGQHDCVHPEDVGITCTNELLCLEGDLRLVDGRFPYEGVLGLCFDGVWNSICDNGWSEEDAQVACRQLGLGTTYVIAYQGLRSSRSSLLDEFECLGTEESLLNCSYIIQENCTARQQAGVFCGAPLDIALLPVGRGDTVFEGGDESMEVCVVITGGPVNNETIIVISSGDGTAQVGFDYTEITGNISVYIYPGYEMVMACEDFDAILDDNIFENPETFEVSIHQLGSASRVNFIQSYSTVTIVDNEIAYVGFNQSSYTVEEMDEIMDVCVELLGDEGSYVLGKPLSVRLSSDGETAEDGVDFIPITQITYFPPGSEPGDGTCVSIPIIDDSLQEQTEAFTAHLFVSDTAVVVTRDFAMIEILDDDMVTCPDLSAPDDGTVTYDVQVGSTAEYGCNEEFELVGAGTRVCQSDGTWSGVAPTCQRRVVTCTVQLVNSVVVGNSATITFNGIGSDITGFICRLDGRNLPECSSPLRLTSLTSGLHRVRVVPQGCEDNQGGTFRITV